MSIFNILNSILFTKKRIDLNLEDENTFGGPFMLNRWISMYSKEMCTLVNSCLNKQYLFDDNHDLYNFYLNFLPKQKFKRINYIKKVKKEKEESASKKREFLSEREHNLYVDLLNQMI
jgi:hypothetical protein